VCFQPQQGLAPSPPPVHPLIHPSNHPFLYLSILSHPPRSISLPVSDLTLHRFVNRKS
jgi:hypothetical protein